MTKSVAIPISTALLLSCLACGGTSGASGTMRFIGASRTLPAGTVLQSADLEVMDATFDCFDYCPPDGPPPLPVVTDKNKLIGKRLNRAIAKHEMIYIQDAEPAN